ncbi:YTH domain-containing protein 1-like isoform X2 [Dendronephthya gigantea]|uniref:YTH domain-containing protein 1-like isoform X2 n=1 Tax=Dendronephthya gigantea TaxID=151771 RepID=UPI00106AA9E6|nr:YTH domain-containing protein 1-like isoform X2 [Dendronephthya gigantea]
MTEEGEISSPDVEEHEMSGENVVNVLDDILGEPAHDEFAAELDKATKPTTPVTPEAPNFPEQSKISTKSQKTVGEVKAHEVSKSKPNSEGKTSPGESRTKPKAPASKKSKVTTPKTKIQAKVKASPSASSSGSEKSKKVTKTATIKGGNQEPGTAAKEKVVSSPAKVKAEVKPKEASKLSQKPKGGIKAKVGAALKVTKAVAKGKSGDISTDEKKTTATEIPHPVTEDGEPRTAEKSNAKPTTEKKKVLKKVVKKAAATIGKFTKSKNVAANKVVKSEEKTQGNVPEKKTIEGAEAGKAEEIVVSDTKAKTDEKTTTVITEKTTAKKRPASSKVVAVKAKKPKQEEKKPVKKAKTVVVAKKSTIKMEEPDDKPKEQAKKELSAEMKDVEKTVVEESESKPDVEMTDETLEDGDETKMDAKQEESDNQMTVVDDVDNSPSASLSKRASRSRSRSRSSYSSNKSGSENESNEGEKPARKRRHKSISPIVYDKDSSASESDSSGSEGSGTPVKSNVDKVEKPNIDEFLLDARFFIMKSSNHENVSLSKAKGVWSTPYANEKRINISLKKYQNVILIFSIKESGKFQGFARVLDEAEYGGRPVPWVLPPGLSAKALGGVFKVEWLNRKDLPFAKCSHLRNPYNDNKDVKICRDGQEVEPNIGRLLCKLFPDDENVNLGSKRRSNRETEHKRVDQGSPRRRSHRHSSPSHRRKRRRRDRDGRHRSRERYESLGLMDPRSRYGVRKETLMHGSYSDYVREFHRSRQPSSVAFPPYGRVDPYAVYADFMRHDRPPSYSRRRR